MMSCRPVALSLGLLVASSAFAGDKSATIIFTKVVEPKCIISVIGGKGGAEIGSPVTVRLTNNTGSSGHNTLSWGDFHSESDGTINPPAPSDIKILFGADGTSVAAGEAYEFPKGTNSTLKVVADSGSFDWAHAGEGNYKATVVVEAKCGIPDII